jgi:hypothetical protein
MTKCFQFCFNFAFSFDLRRYTTGATTLRFSRAGFELRSARALAPGDEATISYGRSFHSFTLELNLSNSRTRS